MFLKSFRFRPFHFRFPPPSILEYKFDSSTFALSVKQKENYFRNSDFTRSEI